MVVVVTVVRVVEYQMVHKSISGRVRHDCCRETPVETTTLVHMILVTEKEPGSLLIKVSYSHLYPSLFHDNLLDPLFLGNIMKRKHSVNHPQWINREDDQKTMIPTIGFIFIPVILLSNIIGLIKGFKRKTFCSDSG